MNPKHPDDLARRRFLGRGAVAGITAAAAAASVSRVAMAALPEPVIETGADTRPLCCRPAAAPTTPWSR